MPAIGVMPPPRGETTPRVAPFLGAVQSAMLSTFGDQPARSGPDSATECSTGMESGASGQSAGQSSP